MKSGQEFHRFERSQRRDEAGVFGARAHWCEEFADVRTSGTRRMFGEHRDSCGQIEACEDRRGVSRDFMHTVEECASAVK